jgi:hypothetical protein
MDVYAADFTGLVQSFKLPRINPNVTPHKNQVTKPCFKKSLSVFTVENILFSTNAIYPMGMQAHLKPLSGMNMYQLN